MSSNILHVSAYDLPVPDPDLLHLFELLASEKPASPAYLVELAGGPGRAPEVSVGGWLPLAELPASSGDPPAGSRQNAGGAASALLRQAVASLAFTGPGRAHPLFRHPFSHGWTGYLTYEAAGLVEPTLRLPSAAGPLYRLLLPGRSVVHDRRSGRLALFIFDRAAPGPSRREEHRREVERIASRLASAGAGRPSEHTRSRPGGVPPLPLDPREMFFSQVVRAQEHIRAGDIFQIVLSRRWLLPAPPRPAELYRALRRLNPSPYHYLLKAGGEHAPTLVGASPERLVSVRAGLVETRPIAGTRPRTGRQREDALTAAELLSDPKERAEHIMLVDLARNDLGRVASYGSVEVPRFMVVEAFSHVLHLVSDVTGDLRPGRDAVDALFSCFPAGTLSGAPKVRAMELIGEIEGRPRGPYGGAVVWLGGPSELESAITIRTAVYEGGQARVQAGAGIVADSVPEREADETEKKAAALFAAAAAAHEEDAR